MGECEGRPPTAPKGRSRGGRSSASTAGISSDEVWRGGGLQSASSSSHSLTMGTPRSVSGGATLRSDSSGSPSSIRETWGGRVSGGSDRSGSGSGSPSTGKDATGTRSMDSSKVGRNPSRGASGSAWGRSTPGLVTYESSGTAADLSVFRRRRRARGPTSRKMARAFGGSPRSSEAGPSSPGCETSRIGAPATAAGAGGTVTSIGERRWASISQAGTEPSSAAARLSGALRSGKTSRKKSTRHWGSSERG